MEGMEGMDILDKLNFFLGEAVSKYKTRRVKHGRKRSQASRMKGSAKRKYKKSLKTRKRKYNNSSAAKSKAKKARKKYVRTAGAKKAKRMYKGKNSARKK